MTATILKLPSALAQVLSKMQARPTARIGTCSTQSYGMDLNAVVLSHPRTIFNMEAFACR